MGENSELLLFLWVPSVLLDGGNCAQAMVILQAENVGLNIGLESF